MPLDPQAQTLLEQMKMMGFAYSPETTVERARELLKAMLAARGEPEPVASVENRLIPGQAGDIDVDDDADARHLHLAGAAVTFLILILFGYLAWPSTGQSRLQRALTERSRQELARIHAPLQQQGGGLKALQLMTGKVDWNAPINADRRGQAGPASAMAISRVLEVRLSVASVRAFFDARS